MWNPFIRHIERARRQREWFEDFADQLEAFIQTLPEGIKVEWERTRRYFNLSIPAPTAAHRQLDIDAAPSGVDYALGKIWGEGYSPTEEIGNRILAACDAVRAGRVREVRDRDTGVLYHLYRLKTRGCDEFMWDSQYTVRAWFKKKVRKVQVARLAALEGFA